ncbi:DapH/DapD/GlmU-related protein [Nitrososphaera viennensis]|mgnify:CR=1 FL=1|uniref:UDP-3-O-(3-hydroxymyristoyl)glucosamine N-acyltransferase n=2 Tax=Nitrososphaera viennensis TaxID=1034015 RepID=A0A977NKQ4_9ARCH|nr:DapH/DapD/GlmU-related protein [Nitrososphaera viennensis]AIC15923.1 putative UDP-3-O-acylglucosamine N-acyltransferase [Nitrososphaera viennensis EN76]UVS67908.1 hypothetical protein NWT39_08325 [Nitrososphaera viennensis]
MSIENKKQFPSQQEAHSYLRTLPAPKPYIHPTAIIENAVLGKDVTIAAYAVIGKEGFGFDPESNYTKRWPHVGNVIIGDNAEIGANTCIDRGTLGSTIIGENTKIDNLVHISHNVRIGKNCVIAAGAVVGGSAEIGDSVFIGLNATIRDHVKVGDNAFICMGAVVTKDVSTGTKVR